MHFQRSLAAGLGTCGLDPRRRPLTGRELRGCWTATQAAGPSDRALPVRPTLPILALEALEPREADWTGRQTLFGEPEAG